MRLSPGAEGFYDLQMLHTLLHSIKNPEVYADLSGRITSFLHHQDMDRMQTWLLEMAIGAMTLAVFVGDPGGGLDAVKRIMAAKVGTKFYSELWDIYINER